MASSIIGHDTVDVFIGVDVGKSEHHAVATDRSGKRLFYRASYHEGEKPDLVGRLKRYGQVLLVVDQPATVGALPVAVARAEGVTVGYLPGLAMRRIADLHPGEAKTDARDAAIIADAARTMPHSFGVRSSSPTYTSRSGRCCAASTHARPAGRGDQQQDPARSHADSSALERVIGAHLDHPAVLDLLHHPSPAALRTAGEKRIGNRLIKLAPRMDAELRRRDNPGRRSKPSSWRDRLPQHRCCHDGRSNWPRCDSNGRNSRSRSNASWRLTLFTAS